MSTPVKVGAFVAGLAVLFGAAFGLGRLFDSGEPSYEMSASYEDGFIRASISDRGSVVLDYDTRHEKKLHLIAVRKDFGDYHHLHPVFDASGGWQVENRLGPGDWRLYADFQASGEEPAVVHDDVTVSGRPDDADPAPGDGLRQSTGGYDVDLVRDAGLLTFQVSRAGKPVTDLEPYLGAYGHLVVIGDPDLTFLHVHPEDAPPGPTIPFALGGADPGHYRMYLEFQHDGVVRTVPFSLHVDDTATDHEEGGMDHGDH